MNLHKILIVKQLNENPCYMGVSMDVDIFHIILYLRAGFMKTEGIISLQPDLKSLFRIKIQWIIYEKKHSLFDGHDHPFYWPFKLQK